MDREEGELEPESEVEPDVVILVGAVVEVEVEVEVDGAFVALAPTSVDASLGAETESDAAGASAVVDAVASTDATFGAETDTEEVLALVCVDTVTVLASTATGSAGDDAETDTPEIPSALASKGAASARASAAAMSANAAAEMCPMFLFMSPTTVNSRNNSWIRLFSSVTRSLVIHSQTWTTLHAAERAEPLRRRASQRLVDP
jgi:hypothetical protein